MNILMVSSFLPHPLYSGGHVRLFNIIKNLYKRHTITLVCEKREYQTQNDIDALLKYCKKVITMNRKKQWGISTLATTGISKYPFLMVGHTQNAMKKTIEELVQKESYDLIHVETFYVMQNVPTDISIPIVLVEHNIEYLVYERFTKSVTSFLRPLLKADIRKIEKWERHFWQTADKLVAVSEKDKSIMERKDTVIVPNGVDLDQFRIQNSEFRIKDREKRILFIGDFKWIQNRDAITWILNDIWPKLTHNSQLITHNLKLWIVGKHIPQFIKEMGGDKNIIFDESVEDTAQIFQKVDLLLAPIRVGGGTSFKILEAMASGVPVITTGLGAEGLEAQDEKEVLIADTTEEIVNHIVQLFKSSTMYESISYNARKLIEKRYDWKVIVQILENTYKDAREVKKGLSSSSVL